MQTKLLVIINVNYDAIHELLIINKYSRKNGNTNGAVHHLSTDIKKAYDSVGRGMLYNILTECDIPMKLVGLTMRDKFVSNTFPIMNGLKREEA
jgi:hypothetical protein